MTADTLQPDGKIIVVGGWPPPSYDSLIVVRLMPNGSLDTTFGTGGVFQYTYSPGVKTEPLAVTLQTVLNDAREPETRAVITGTIAVGVGYHHTVAFLLRLTKDAIGSGLDATFGTYGVLQSEVPGADSTYYTDITCDSRNRIVAGGMATYGLNSPPVTSDMVVARFLEDSRADMTFSGGSGMFTGRWENDSHLYGIAVQPDDEILAVGMIPYPGLAAVWRLGTDGLLDANGFGSGGLATTAGQFWDITLVHRPDGPDAFVVAGRAYPPKGGNSAGLWALWRYFY